MSIKEQIQKDFIIALKAKDDNAKAALSSIKTAITIAEKTDGTDNLSDDNVIKLLTKAIKQREESQKIYEDAGREILADKECDEATVLRKYMPKQMTPEEIKEALNKIMEGFASSVTNPTALQGRTIGEFNKQYNGRADIAIVKNLLTEIIQK